MEPESWIIKSYVKAPETIIGYHGCPRPIAEQILTAQRFLPSTRAYDWLGEGAYFWEYGPFRALEWAHNRCEATGEEPAVIGATIRPGRCLNVLDTEHIPGLETTYADFVETIGTAKLPKNTERGAHFLDRHVIDSYCRAMERNTKLSFQTVRGSFPEGGAIYEGSKILRKAHTQIAVRDVSCIFDLHLVEFP